MAQTYVVQQGDCLSSIAKHFGLRDWKVIYDDPNNKDFKKARPDPNVIFPGDELFIPDAKPNDKKASASVETLNKFKVKLPYTLLRVKVEDEEEQPLKGKKYALTFGNDVRKGSTTGEGVVEEKIDPNVVEATLVVYDKDEKGPYWQWDVHVGYLDPVETVQGVKERLNNLGYTCGTPNETIDKRTKLALAGFQKDQGMKPTGKLDDATRDKLKTAHGKR